MGVESPKVDRQVIQERLQEIKNIIEILLYPYSRVEGPYRCADPVTVMGSYPIIIKYKIEEYGMPDTYREIIFSMKYWENTYACSLSIPYVIELDIEETYWQDVLYRSFVPQIKEIIQKLITHIKLRQMQIATANIKKYKTIPEDLIKKVYPEVTSFTKEE